MNLVKLIFYLTLFTLITFYFAKLHINSSQKPEESSGTLIAYYLFFGILGYWIFALDFSSTFGYNNELLNGLLIAIWYIPSIIIHYKQKTKSLFQ